MGNVGRLHSPTHLPPVAAVTSWLASLILPLPLSNSVSSQLPENVFKKVSQILSFPCSEPSMASHSAWNRSQAPDHGLQSPMWSGPSASLPSLLSNSTSLFSFIPQGLCVYTILCLEPFPWVLTGLPLWRSDLSTCVLHPRRRPKHVMCSSKHLSLNDIILFTCLSFISQPWIPWGEQRPGWLGPPPSPQCCKLHWAQRTRSKDIRFRLDP